MAGNRALVMPRRFARPDRLRQREHHPAFGFSGWRVALPFILPTIVGLLVFNIIPLPPLDGHHVLYYFLPPKGKELMENIGPFGIIIAIVFVSRPWLAATMPVAMKLLLGVAAAGVLTEGQLQDLLYGL